MSYNVYIFLFYVVPGQNKKKTVSGMEGDSVTLNSDIEIKDDLILWMFRPEDCLIAKGETKKNISSYDGADGKFRGKLKLNYGSGSLSQTPELNTLEFINYRSSAAERPNIRHSELQTVLSNMNELMMHLYSALLCIVVHPKHFTIMWGGLSSTTISLHHPLG